MKLKIESAGGQDIRGEYRDHERDSINFFAFQGRSFITDGDYKTLFYTPPPSEVPVGQHYIVVNSHRGPSGLSAVLVKDDDKVRGHGVLEIWHDNEGVAVWEPTTDKRVKDLFGEQEIPQIKVSRF